MALISVKCPTCKGEGNLAIPFPPPLQRGMRIVECIPCHGTGSILVHTSSISGNTATRVVTDNPWDAVWEQIDLFPDIEEPT